MKGYTGYKGLILCPSWLMMTLTSTDYPPWCFWCFCCGLMAAGCWFGRIPHVVATYQLCHLVTDFQKCTVRFFTYHFEFFMNLPQGQNQHLKKQPCNRTNQKKTHLVQLSMARWNTHHVPSMDPTAAGTTRWHGATASSYLGGLRLLRARLRARVIGGGPLGMVFLYRFFSWRSALVGYIYPRKIGGWLRGVYFMKMRVMGHIVFGKQIVWTKKVWFVNVNLDILCFFLFCANDCENYWLGSYVCNKPIDKTQSHISGTSTRSHIVCWHNITCPSTLEVELSL